MTSCVPKIYRKRQLLAKVQTNCQTPASLAATDGKIRIEVGSDATPEVNMNERNQATRTLAKLPDVPGAVVGKYSCVVEAAGSGAIITEPEYDALLRGCGLRKIVLHYLTAESLPLVENLERNAVLVGAISGAQARVVVPTNEYTTKVIIEVLSGTFQNELINIQDGTAGVFTAEGAQVAGGFSYVPADNSSYEFLTLQAQEDGMVKNIWNAQGTFSFAVESSGIGKFSFEFTGVVDKDAMTCDFTASSGTPIAQGTYLYSGQNVIVLLQPFDGTNNPVFAVMAGVADNASVWLNGAGSAGFTIDSVPVKYAFGAKDMTTGIEFYNTLPPILQNSESKIGEFSPVFNSINIDIANNVAARPNGNSRTGLVSGYITDRASTGSIDPEVVNDSDFDIYNDWFNGELKSFQFRLGDTEGNQLFMFCKAVQPSEVTDGDRETMAINNLTFKLTGRDNDDFELVHF